MALATVLLTLLATTAPAEATRPWRDDPLFRRIAERLDRVAAIDNHTHLLDKAPFDPALDAMMPLPLRSTSPAMADAMRDRFAIPAGVTGPALAQRATEARDAMLARRGAARYWADHLDATRTAIALVNQDFPEGTDGKRLRWVPSATNLMHPLPAEALEARSPGHAKDIRATRANLQRFLAEAGLKEAPADLAGYMGFVERTLDRWKEQGAVGVKFWDAYLRTLVFDDVPEEKAAALYAKGRATALPRDEYLALQDYLARRIFLAAGPRRLAVHIHSSHGVPPFLRTMESDVRNLEPVLTDVRYFGTQFVLIHGGMPLVEHAAYLALKPHVWYDMSAMPFLYPVPEMAEALRKVLTFAPEKLLFGTDVSTPVIVGTDLQHVALSRAAREALALALAGLVRDGVVDLETAVRMGESALHGNARRLYGWPPE
jgi:predicted TIM-barrel fold metal-dependent hydrolase